MKVQRWGNGMAYQISRDLIKIIVYKIIFLHPNSRPIHLNGIKVTGKVLFIKENFIGES